jgi:hypothetical protein
MKKIVALEILSLLVVFGLLVTPPAWAQNTQGPCATSNSIADCVASIYRWSLGVAVLLALIMIIVSGYLYMTAGGNAQSVSLAKEMFTGAFIGLIILFAAVLILRTISPELVSFKPLPPITNTP